MHHLLHTHEMLAHTLLVAHNLSVLNAFFAGIRDVLSRGDGLTTFRAEMERFCKTYDETLVVFEEARQDWMEVDRARGKGHLSREKPDIEPMDA